MFELTKCHTYIDKEIAKAVLELGDHEVGSVGYEIILERLSKLQKIRVEEKPERISPDTVVLAVTNILGILMIVHHEHLNVITSKAMSFVVKPK